LARDAYAPAGPPRRGKLSPSAATGGASTTRILLRADDLGYSRGVNCGLAWACDNGLPMSVGLMTNLPDVRHGHGLVAGKGHCLGMHTTISAGRPLSDPDAMSLS
jgi:predicted glycoside hydrolase/deacetylase ChbG (UPF0249 family)